MPTRKEAMKRNAGMTTFELVVVCFVLLAVVVLLFPVRCDTGRRNRSKHNVSLATVQEFSVALKAYETDFGDYPPDESGYYITQGKKGSLVDVLSSKGPKGIPYYVFREDQFNEKGQWVTALKTPFKYRKNSGRPATAPDPASMMNVRSFDMWASGNYDEPGCDPETSEPASKASIKNW
jgi:hypothetical protein